MTRSLIKGAHGTGEARGGAGVLVEKTEFGTSSKPVDSESA